jgi:hypothetical protein
VVAAGRASPYVIGGMGPPADGFPPALAVRRLGRHFSLTAQGLNLHLPFFLTVARQPGVPAFRLIGMANQP